MHTTVSYASMGKKLSNVGPRSKLSSEEKWSINLPPYATLTKHLLFFLFFTQSLNLHLKVVRWQKLEEEEKKFLLCSRAGFDSFFFNIIGCTSWTSIEQSQHGFGLIQKFLVVSFVNCGPQLFTFNAIGIQNLLYFT